jgi:hypothetical protein
MTLEFAATPNLNAALAAAKPNFELIIADESADYATKAGGRIRWDYADLDDIHPSVTKALSENGLALSSQIRHVGDPSLIGGSGRLYLVTRLLHSSGESLESYFPLPLPDVDPKPFGAMVTFGRRYNTQSLLELSVVTDEEAKRQRRTKAAQEIQKDISSKSGASARSKDSKPAKPAPSASSKPELTLLPALGEVPESKPVEKPPEKPPTQYLHPKQNFDIRALRDRLNIGSDVVLEKTKGIHPGNLTIEQYEQLAKDLALSAVMTENKFVGMESAKEDLENVLESFSGTMPFIDSLHLWLDMSEDDDAVSRAAMQLLADTQIKKATEKV